MINKEFCRSCGKELSVDFQTEDDRNIESMMVVYICKNKGCKDFGKHFCYAKGVDWFMFKLVSTDRGNKKGLIGETTGIIWQMDSSPIKCRITYPDGTSIWTKASNIIVEEK
jgi:hypothetical protein